MANVDKGLILLCAYHTVYGNRALKIQKKNNKCSRHNNSISVIWPDAQQCKLIIRVRICSCQVSMSV